MPKLPILKPREVVSILNHLGFIEVRQRGSHKQFRHRMDASPRYHSTQVGTSHQIFSAEIIEDIGLTSEEFLKHLEPQPNSAWQRPRPSVAQQLDFNYNL